MGQRVRRIVILSNGAYTEDQIWGMRVSKFASLERDLDDILREQVVNQAKAFALGSASDPDKAIRGYANREYW